MKAILDRYRRYQALKAKSKTYKIGRVLILSIACAYLLLLCFPQVLFAHELTYKGLTIYSRTPLDGNIYVVLDRAESKLAASPIYSRQVEPKLFLVNSSSSYAALSLYLGSNSFGKGYAALPTGNFFLNRHDLARDLVFRDAAVHNVRSLSGVIAHESTHLLIRNRYGYWRNLAIPSWKKEGYAEYVAGGSTLSHDDGVKMWKARPDDATGYQYFKYYMLVKYLLEDENVSVDDLFKRDFDTDALADIVFKRL